MSSIAKVSRAGLALVALAGCYPRTDRLDLGLRDPTQVRVEVRQRSILGDEPSSLTLDEGEEGDGRTSLHDTGLLAERHTLETRAMRGGDGALDLHVARLPDDDDPPVQDPELVKRVVLWTRHGDELRFQNASLRASGTWVASDAATWRFDRSAPRLVVETHAALSWTHGGLVNEDAVHLPSVTVSTPMSNVRWLRAVTVERRSTGFWLLGATVFGGALSATMFHLATRWNDPPQPLFVGLGIGTGTVALASAVFAGVAFVRGDRETARDLVAPHVQP